MGWARPAGKLWLAFNVSVCYQALGFSLILSPVTKYSPFSPKVISSASGCLECLLGRRKGFIMRKINVEFREKGVPLQDLKTNINTIFIQ